MGTVQFWSICLLAAVLALLPRVCVITLRNSLRPPEVVRVVMQAASAAAASASATSDVELYKVGGGGVFTKGLDCESYQ